MEPKINEKITNQRPAIIQWGELRQYFEQRISIMSNRKRPS